MDGSDLINGLTIHRVLGIGYFGFVFDVTTPSNGRQAHKIFPASSNSNPDIECGNPLQEFEREGNMTDMKHANVVRIHSIEAIPPGQNILELYKRFLQEPYPFHLDNADRLYYHFKSRSQRSFPIIRVTMELCGPTLKSWLQSTNGLQVIDADFSFRKDIGQGIIQGLKYLHQEQHVIHRDLKPDNIFFSDDGNHGQQFLLPVKIGDFGLCRPADGDNSTTKTAGVGSHLYRAHDVGKENDDKAKYSYRADLYSLGLILFEMFQLIPEKQRVKHFDDLVLFKNEQLVAYNQRFPRLKETIIGLTRRRSGDRIQSIDLVHPFTLE